MRIVTVFSFWAVSQIPRLACGFAFGYAVTSRSLGMTCRLGCRSQPAVISPLRNIRPAREGPDLDLPAVRGGLVADDAEIGMGVELGQ